MRTVSAWTLSLMMAMGIALSSCGKKGALETPPPKDEEKVSALDLDSRDLSSFYD